MLNMVLGFHFRSQCGLRSFLLSPLSLPSSPAPPTALQCYKTSSLGGDPLTPFPLPSSGGCCMCLCLWSQAHLSSLNGVEDSLWRWLALLTWWFLFPLPFLPICTIHCCLWGCFVCRYPWLLCQLHLELVPGPYACSHLSWPWARCFIAVVLLAAYCLEQLCLG